jgi:hypothetical protein
MHNMHFFPPLQTNRGNLSLTRRGTYITRI